MSQVLLDQAEKAQKNHSDAMAELQTALQQASPNHVEEALARQAIMSDRLTSFLTYQTWLRNASGSDLDDLNINDE